MVNRREPVGAQKKLRLSASTVEKQTTSMHKVEPIQVRRSARLRAKSQLKSSGNGRKESESGLLLTGEISQDRVRPTNTSKKASKRKRGEEELQDPSPLKQDPPPPKQPRSSAQSTPEGQPQEAEKNASTPVAGPLQNWVLNKKWPSEYFEPDDQTREELLERDSWLEEIMKYSPVSVVQYVEIDGFRYPLPIKKVPASLRTKQSGSGLGGSSDQTREGRSTPYRDPRYPTMLETHGSFLYDFDHQPLKAVTDLCHQLLTSDQITPQNSLFRDDLFGRFCWKVKDRNEAMIVQDSTRLIVPSAMNLAIYGDKNLHILIDNVNEAWVSSIPIEGPRPQPDYTVGFDRSAFTDEQTKKLSPLIGTVFDTSFFVATFRMYFPFLTCEVKCGTAGLDIADRQNAHSMTIAVRGVVELYRAVKREKELNRQILAFSISHDQQSVRIYGHYPIIDEDKVTYYRHPVHAFSFTSLEGRDKWTAYRFTKNVYDLWMPTHLKRICSVIEQLPSVDFEVS